LLLQKYLLLGEIARDPKLRRTPAAAVAHQLLEWYGARQPGLTEASFTSLAKATGISSETAKRVVRMLIKGGYFRHRPGGPDHTPNLYFPRFAPRSPKELLVSRMTLVSPMTPPSGVTNDPPSGVSNDTHKDIEESIHPLTREERARPRRRDGRMMGGSKTTQSPRSPTAVPAGNPDSQKVIRSTAIAAARRQPQRATNTRAGREAALRNYQPGPDTTAYLSEHCAAVLDWDSSAHVEKFRHWYLAHPKVIPPDIDAIDAAFRKWMLDQPRFAKDDTPRTGQRRSSSAMNALENILPDLDAIVEQAQRSEKGRRK
jgi:hypothetical protein